MKKDVRRYIELICHCMDDLSQCLLIDAPCESCPYNEHIEDEDYPCYKKALDDLKICIGR